MRCRCLLSGVRGSRIGHLRHLTKEQTSWEHLTTISQRQFCSRFPSQPPSVVSTEVLFILLDILPRLYMVVIISSHVHHLTVIPIGPQRQNSVEEADLAHSHRTRQCKVIAPLSLAIRHCGHDTSYFSPLPPPTRWPSQRVHNFRASNNDPLFIGYRDPRLANFLASPSPTHSPSSPSTRGTTQTNHPSTSSHVLTSPAFPISNEAFCSPRPCRRVGSLRSARLHRCSSVHLQALLSVSLVTAGRFGGSQPMRYQARPALMHMLRAPEPAKSYCRPAPLAACC